MFTLERTVRTTIDVLDLDQYFDGLYFILKPVVTVTGEALRTMLHML